MTYAEELGFDSVWIGEHYFDRSICLAQKIFAAATAWRTRRVRTSTAIILLPHHNPIRLAEDYALVDLLSGGRLGLGAGRWFLKATYDGFNQAMAEAVCLRPVAFSYASTRLRATSPASSAA